MRDVFSPEINIKFSWNELIASGSADARQKRGIH